MNSFDNNMSKNWMIRCLVLCEILSAAIASDTTVNNQPQMKCKTDFANLDSTLSELIGVERHALAKLTQLISKIQKHHFQRNILNTAGTVMKISGYVALIAILVRRWLPAVILNQAIWLPETILKLAIWLSSVIMEIVYWLFKAIVELVNWLFKAIVELVNWLFRAIVELVYWLFKAIVELVNWLFKAIVELVNWLFKAIVELVNWLLRASVELVDWLFRAFMELAIWFSTAMRMEATKFLETILRQIFRLLRADLQQAINMTNRAGLLLIGTIIVDTVVTTSFIYEVNHILEIENKVSVELEELQTDLQRFALIFDHMAEDTTQKHWMEEDLLLLLQLGKDVRGAVKDAKNVFQGRKDGIDWWKDITNAVRKEITLNIIADMHSVVRGWTEKHPTREVIEELQSKVQKRIDQLENFLLKIKLI